MSLFTDDQYKKAIDQVKQVKIKLHDNPVVYGVASINQKLSEIQNSMEFIHELFVDAIRNYTAAKIYYKQKKTEYDMELNRLSAEDQSVKSAGAADARKAMASTKSAHLQLEEHNANIELLKAESYLNLIQQTYKHLENSYESLSRQITATQLAAGLGGIDANDFKSQDKNIKIEKSEE